MTPAAEIMSPALKMGQNGSVSVFHRHDVRYSFVWLLGKPVLVNLTPKLGNKMLFLMNTVKFTT